MNGAVFPSVIGGARERRAWAAMDIAGGPAAGGPAAGGNATDYDVRMPDELGISVLFDKIERAQRRRSRSQGEGGNGIETRMHPENSPSG